MRIYLLNAVLVRFKNMIRVTVSSVSAATANTYPVDPSHYVQVECNLIGIMIPDGNIPKIVTHPRMLVA